MAILTSNPWENGVIIVGLICAGLLGGVIVGGAGYLSWTNGEIGDIVSRVILFIPVALVMFGFIGDAVMGDYHYSIASLTSIIGMILNKLGGDYVGPVLGNLREYIPFGRAVAADRPADDAWGDAAVPDVPDVNPFAGGQRGGVIECSLPGFEWLENTFAPQGLVMSMTVLFYILIEMWDTGRTSNSLGIGMITLFTFLLQGVTFVRNDCLTRYTYGKWSILIALVMGITFAGSAYGTVKATSKYLGGAPAGGGTRSAKTSFSMNTNTDKVCPAGTHLSPEGNCVGVGSEEIPVGQFQGEKSSPTDPNDQFVCEAYKDGELITSTIAS